MSLSLKTITSYNTDFAAAYRTLVWYDAPASAWHTFCLDNVNCGKTTNTVSGLTSAQAAGLKVSFRIDGSALSDGHAHLFAYDVYLTYGGGTLWRPSEYEVTTGSGVTSITNPEYAIDEDPDTYADIYRWHTSPLGFSGELIVSGFQAGPGAGCRYHGF